MLQFEHRRTPASVGELTEVQRVQLRKAGLHYDGNDWSAERRLDPSWRGEEGCFLGELLELWDVLADEQHVYDAWFYAPGRGIVFRTGTTEVVAEMAEFDFECEGRELSEELAEARERAVSQSKRLGVAIHDA